MHLNISLRENKNKQQQQLTALKQYLIPNIGMAKSSFNLNAMTVNLAVPSIIVLTNVSNTYKFDSHHFFATFGISSISKIPHVCEQ